MARTITDSMSWRRAALVAALTIVAASGATADTKPSSPDVAGAPAAATQTVTDRQTSLDAHEARLRLYENELARQAKSQAAAAEHGPAVTPSDLVSAIAVSSALTMLITLLALRFLENLGMWRGKSGKAKRELEALERRVLTGLRELDTLLTRLYDRTEEGLAQAPAPKKTPRRGLDADRLGAPRVAPAEIPDRPVKGMPAPMSERRREVIALAEEGLDTAEIGRLTRLGPGEVKLILKLAHAR